MPETITPPADLKNISDKEIFDLLVAGANTDDNKKVVLLFNNSKEIRSFSDSMGRELRSNPTFSIDKTKALLIRTNLLQSNNTKVFLGLKMDEELLTNDYDADEIKYHEARND